MGNLPNTLMDAISSEYLTLENGDSFQLIRTKDRKYKTAPYFCIGKKGSTAYLDPFAKKKIYTQGLDVTEIFVQLPSSALSLFWKLVSIRNPKTNVVNLTHSDLTSSDKNRLKKFLKNLLTHQLVYKIKRGFILINPKAILPDYGYYDSVELRWNQLQIEHQLKHSNSTNTHNAYNQANDIIDLSLVSAGIMDTPIEFNDEYNEHKETIQTASKTLKLTL